MRRFTELFCALEQTNRTNEKVASMESYFRDAPPRDAAWALRFLSGHLLPRAVNTRLLREWAAAEAGIALWLLDECHEAVGDLAETLSLILPRPGVGIPSSLADLVDRHLSVLRRMPENARREQLVELWRQMDRPQRLVWNKLIVGNFRVGVSKTLVIRALANVAGIDPAIMAHRVSGKWQPTGEDYCRLLSAVEGLSEPAKPYPFFLASAIELTVNESGDFEKALGSPDQWQFEWKRDGIRAQIIRRGEASLIWSRGEELVSDAFPELVEAGTALPSGTVLDGEILAWEGGDPLPFARLQRRLNRKISTHSEQLAHPVAFVAYDVLESNGKDIRDEPLEKRRRILEELVADLPRLLSREKKIEKDHQYSLFDEENAETLAQPIRLSPLLTAANWDELRQMQQRSRALGVEGLMVKRRVSAYGVGRQRGDWWKWKIQPFVLDAVLIYAQQGHGRRASLFTDYTFGVWDKGELVPVAKAYSGLTDEEIQEVDAFVRRNSVESFGPVRVVKAELVFELAFEGIQKSDRHKAGIAVRFPRMNRWRKDKKPAEADSLETLITMAAEADRSRPGGGIRP